MRRKQNVNSTNTTSANNSDTDNDTNDSDKSNNNNYKITSFSSQQVRHSFPSSGSDGKSGTVD